MKLCLPTGFPSLSFRYGNNALLTVFMFLFLSICSQHSLLAQKTEKIPSTPVICPAKFEDMNTRRGIPEVSPKEFQSTLKVAATAEFIVTFGPGAQANPEAMAAFQFALDIWSNLIVSAVPIKVFADFANLGTGVLASARPAYNVINFPNAPEPDVLYPAALANALSGQVLFPDEDFDLLINLGNSIPWYFGLDGNTPAGLFDFVTVALHEAGHGLGFTTTRSFSAGVGSLRSGGNPSVYGLFMVDGDGNLLLDLPDPSTQLGDAFTSGDLFMDGLFTKNALGGNRPELYAPSVFQGGSSLAHWDEAAFPAGDINSLMTPQIGSAESNFDIGNITRGLFKDMGWVLNDAEVPLIVVAPTSINEELSVGDVVRRPIEITNISDSELTVSASSSDGSATIELFDPAELTIASGASASLEVQFNTSGLPKGVYEETIVLNVLDTESSVDVPVSIRVLDGTEAPAIVVSPTSFTETIQRFKTETRELTLENTGDADLTFNITVNDVPLSAFSDRVKMTNTAIKTTGFITERFSMRGQSSDLSALSMTTTDNYDKLVSTVYATDFEDFAIGDVNGQLGWASQFADNWVISSANPFEGSQHFRGISDGLGPDRPAVPLALTPAVATGDEPFMVTSARINIQGEGTFWQVTPQSPTSQLVVTRVQFNGDGSIQVLDAGAGGFVTIDAVTPVGYFDLKIVIDKDDLALVVYIDNEPVFSGTGFTPLMEQVVIISDMATSGPTMDVDNLEITDGDPNAFFVSVSPVSGTVAFGTSSVLSVKFDARTLAAGEYAATINVNSNDADNPSIDIPVNLSVLQPPTIVVTPDSLSAAVNVQTDDPPTQTESFTISNAGESPLEFTTALGPIGFTPPVSTSLISVESLDLRNYGLGNTVKLEEKLAGPSGQSTLSKRDVQLSNAVAFTDSIFYDTGLEFPDNFSGVDTAPYTSAINFDVESDFTLNAVRNGYRTETVTDPVIILEIYKGGATPNDGELLLTQTFTQASAEGIVVAEVLDTALDFSAGESFWVVHKYPDGISFPQGVDDGATQRPDTYFFSSDGGTTYSPSGFVFFVRALSGGDTAAYITLEPSSGSVAPGGSVDVLATFDGGALANGTYARDILVSSNDPITPTASVATTFDVSGQVSEIEVSDELLLFNDVFIGAERERAFTIANNGLAQLNVSAISSDNDDFTVDASSATLQAGESLEVTVSFRPSQLGSINGIISIASDAPNAQLVEIIVNGIGVEPPIAVLDPREISETTDARTTIDSQITLKNDGNSPLIFSFPDLAVAAALAKPDVKLNNTDYIAFNGFSGDQEKGFTDSRVGTEVLYSIGTDNGFGYKWIDSDENGGPVYNFNDISVSGTDITSDVGADGTLEVALSFPFEFYGIENTNIFINANGFLAFQAPGSSPWVNLQIPVDDRTNNVIAGFWDDLEPQNFNGSVHFADLADRFIVQWTTTSRFQGSADETVTFQIVLYADGNIDVFYENVDTASFVTSATVGIENADGSDGAQVAFNTPYIKDGLAVRFVKPAIPLTAFIGNVNPISGVVAAGGSRPLTVTLDATNLNDGVYYDELGVSSNDPIGEASTALFELTVIGFPEILATPDSLAFEPLFISLDSEASFLLENIGTKVLEIASISNENTDFVLDETGPVSLQPAESLIVNVVFSPSSIGLIEDEITIISNDVFGNESLTVGLSGVGVDPPVIDVSPVLLDLVVAKRDSVTETVTIANNGGSTMNYSLSPPFFARAQDAAQEVLQYPKLEFAKIPSKESLDTRVGATFLNASGGPGTFGYTWIDNNSEGPAYDFIDISTTGQVANVGNDGNETVALPFAFNFFGNQENEVTIGANGFLTFAPIVGSNFINRQIPSTGSPDLLIAALWDDLEPEDGGGVFYQGTADYFIVQYENVPGFGFPPFLPIPDPVTFQVILFPDGSIKMQYENLDSTIRTNSTVGVEGPQGLSGLQVIFNNEFLTNGLAITFTPPVTGTVEPGETAEVPVTFVTDGLEGGQTYFGDIVVGSNDPVTPEVNVPVSLEVLNVPEVVSFSLINAETNEIIGPLNEGDIIDLNDYAANKFSVVANIGILDVGSVVFDFNNIIGFQIENRAPYALNGFNSKKDSYNPVALPLGNNTITATPYSGRKGSGDPGIPLTVNFEVIETYDVAIVSFMLINADTNETIGILNDGDIVDLNDYPSNSFSVVANTSSLDVGSVVFDFNGAVGFRTENRTPYALNGYNRKKSTYKPVAFPLGNNTITATPYSEKKGSGIAGIALTVDFEVIDDVSLALKSAEGLNKLTSNQSVEGSIYPNPVTEFAFFAMKDDKAKLYGTLYNLSGQAIYSSVLQQGDQNKFLDMSSIAQGTYILRLTDDKGAIISQTRVLKK